eukprot:CAMPEP_0185786416 /NCGR_PEP_ID=MMETSP1174-20130828/135288_1 /TAXON_ID=35687 /ORGANISM="Dictyocha speculum, Strain CCMP1381" /LENGTH=58 /DNA_ID=CAMNT_0028479039 /DNA_START=109 /DNA_END=285 /DNA_ORIENTATION=+
MYTWHDNALVFVEIYGVPCDKEQSSFAEFFEEHVDVQEDDDSPKAKMKESNEAVIAVA